ncbi:ribosome maturation factor RimP [Thermovibrio sp.]
MEEKAKEIVERVKELLAPILEEGGFELVDIEFVREPVGWVLRIYADRPQGGITISDCQWISERIGTILDVEDVIPHSYNLEVSSPGLDRPLKSQKDFERHKGIVVKIKTTEPLDNQRNFKGEVISTSERGVTVHDVSRNAEVEIPYEKIKSARVDIDSLFDK